MSLQRNELPETVSALLARGTVIPAHPLALDSDRKLDPVRQRALSRYYIDAGAGGLAVGVHATQFAIREAGLYAAVLECAMETARDWAAKMPVMIAGLAGPTRQAIAEASTAVEMGYHAGLLSLAALKGASEDELIGHCREIAAGIPLIGFYLQPAVGGIPLSPSFWKRFAEIDNVVAIKAAPFDRYAMLDVIRGVVEAGAEDRVAIYTGNDDHILLDLLEPFVTLRGSEQVTVRIRGGLLGQWSVWTQRAVELLQTAQRAVNEDYVDAELLEMNSKLTDCNRAIFDVANGFAGCIPGCHEILRRQGLLKGIWCLDPREGLSPGQSEEIDRICAGYPELNDDEFVRTNLERWLS